MSTSRPDPEQSESAAPDVTHVAEGQPISLAVVEAVASASGRPPLRDRSAGDGVGPAPLPPLNETIDPDALDALCRPGLAGTGAATRVSFTYCGYDVTVESSGRVTVVEA